MDAATIISSHGYITLSIQPTGYSHILFAFCGISNEAGNAVTFFLLFLSFFDNTYELLLYTADEIKTKNNELKKITFETQHFD